MEAKQWQKWYRATQKIQRERAKQRKIAFDTRIAELKATSTLVGESGDTK